MSDRVIHVYGDGHQLLDDGRQGIVQHTPTCKNAQRGPAHGTHWAYAKKTFFLTVDGFRQELLMCGLGWPPPVAPPSLRP